MFKMFNTLTFNEVRTGHFQAMQQFGNYQLSVVLLPGKTLYEAAVFEDDKFIQLPGIHNDDDVIPNLTPAAVSNIMLKLSCVTGTLGEP
jgi:hypothetical protein